MKSTSFRLPEATISQLERLAKRSGMTLTQTLIVAIDRMAKEANHASRALPRLADSPGSQKAD